MSTIIKTCSFDWFYTKLLKYLGNASYSNDSIALFNADSESFTYFGNNIGLPNVSFNKFTLFMVVLTIIILIAWCNRYKQRKVCKKEISKESMP